MIRATDISLSIRGKHILQPLSCSFDTSEFVAVIGPNGAGKSTLLQLLSGLQEPSTGNVTIHDHPVGKWPPEELAGVRAYLQQQHSVFESFSVADVLMMGRSIHFNYQPSQTDQELVGQILEELNLVHRKEQAFNSLSGGEQQRVQFARTLLQLQQDQTSSFRQKIVFLDEPLNNLDLHYQYNLLQMAREKVVNTGGLIIAVLHDLNSAYQFADRVILLYEGRIQADAPTVEAMNAELLSSVYDIPIRKKEMGGQAYFMVEQQTAFNFLNTNEQELSYH